MFLTRVWSSLARLIQTGVYNRGGWVKTWGAETERTGGGRKLWSCREGQGEKRGPGSTSRRMSLLTPGLPSYQWLLDKHRQMSWRGSGGEERQRWKCREITQRGQKENKEQEVHCQRERERDQGLNPAQLWGAPVHGWTSSSRQP